MGTTLDILDKEVRLKIAADNDVLNEAKKRRDLVAAAAMEYEGSLRWFKSGSVAHAMVNKPVSDADSGLVLDRRNPKFAKLGPDGEGEGPDDVLDEIEDLIRPVILETYAAASISRSRRGLVIEFNNAVTEDEDPTVDLIVTLTRKDAEGLWIPDLDAADQSKRWSPSHPEKHTELFTAEPKKLRVLRARVARMAKAWNKQWQEGDRALSSFNIAALALEAIDDSSIPLDKALANWFHYSADELEKGPTKDPAGISEPIRMLLDQNEVVRRLRGAADAMDEALENEDDEDKVRQALRRVYRDYIEEPAGKRALAEALRTNAAHATTAGIAVVGGRQMKNTRAFGRDYNG